MSTIEQRQLGETDLKIAPLVFGGNVLGWTIDEATSFQLLDQFVELGFNAIDTADVYSRWADGHVGGESETIIGKWMKHRNNRDQIVVITKVGSDMGQGKRDLSEQHILQAADKSLERLQTDYIDLYLTHWDDDVTPVEETLGAYQKLIDAGKVRWIGASNLSPERLQASLDASKTDGLPKYQVFQPEYNLYARKGYETGVAPICTENNLGIITYFSLASGFLTGKYRSEDDYDKSVRGGGMSKYMNERGMRILSALDDLAEKHQATHAGIAMAWLLAQPIVTAPIASGTKSAHVDAFKEAVTLDLTSEDIASLDEASAY